MPEPALSKCDVENSNSLDNIAGAAAVLSGILESPPWLNSGSYLGPRKIRAGQNHRQCTVHYSFSYAPPSRR